MLTRFLLIFALGIACVLLAFIAIVGSWVIAASALVVGAVAVLLWGLLLGMGRKKLSDTDPADEDLERAKTAQYHVCDKARTGGVG
jgi:xanthine/uracil permease